MSAGFTPAQRIAVLAVGIVGVLIPGLQPQLLGALAQEGRVSASLLGHVATAELLTMGIAAGGAGFVLSIARLRGIAIAAILASVALDLLTLRVGGGWLVAVRAAAGVSEGVLIWIAIGLIVRAAQPARWSGIYLAVQTLAQFAVATMLGAYVVPAAGSAGGFTTLAIVTAAGLIALPWLPRAYAPLERIEPEPNQPFVSSEVEKRRATPGTRFSTSLETNGSENFRNAIPLRGFVALAGVLVYMAFIVAVWVYVEPLGLQRGVDASTVAMVAPLSLAMQVLGAGLATLLAGRLPVLPTLIAVGVANLALLAVIGAPPSSAAFLAATALFGFLWLFALPFQIPAVIAADPGRRAAALIGGAQLVGASLGPFAAALLVGEDDVSAVLPFGAACILVAIALIVAAAWRRPAVAVAR